MINSFFNVERTFDYFVGDIGFCEIQQLISDISVFLIRYDYFPFLFTQRNLKNNPRDLKGVNHAVINAGTLLIPRETLLVEFPTSHEEIMRVLISLEKFVIDINATEFPILFFSKKNLSFWKEYMYRERKLLKATGFLRLLTDSGIRKFFNSHQTDVFSILSLYDECLFLYVNSSLLPEISSEFETELSGIFRCGNGNRPRHDLS